MPSSQRARVRFALAFVALGWAACAEPEPEWVDLTADFRPAPSGSPADGSALAPYAASGDTDGRRTTLFEDAGGWWLKTALTRADWEPAALPGVWRTARPSVAVGAPELGGAQRFAVGEQRFLPVPVASVTNLAAIPPDSFAAYGDQLYLLPVSGAPPDEATFWSYLDLGERSGEHWRVELDGFASSALPVLPGTRERVTVSLSHDAGLALRFRTLTVGPPDGEVALRVRVGGELLFETVQATGLTPTLANHVVPLPDDLPRSAGSLQLDFECEGPPAFAAFATPSIGPAEIGTYGERPWTRGGGQPRPNLVLFVADTFRADNLTSYGGAGLAPRLDDLAAESVVFTRMRASSSWTLPSHASVLSGLHPPQHGAVASDGTPLRLADEAVTIAEVLREAGYRTVAVTERGWVAPEFGLAQGFEVFEDQPGFENTIERATALAAEDDGRPLFLFVHSYRTHAPYEVSDAVRAELGIEETWADLDAQLRPGAPDWPKATQPTPEVRGAVDALRRLYAGTVVEFDRGAGELLDRLEDLEVLGGDDVLVLLSDHGEAFGEHGEIWHGFGVWDELTRVPLLIRAPAQLAQLGGEPLFGPTARPASHVDVAPTIAQLLDTPRHPSWPGRSLFGPPARDGLHPVFSYACRAEGPRVDALLDGTRKVLLGPGGVAQPDVVGTFDLERDPGEQGEGFASPLAPEEIAELLRRWAARFESADEPQLFPKSATLTKEREAELRALGYL